VTIPGLYSNKLRRERMTGEQFLNSIRFLDAEISALDYERVKVMDQRQDLLDAAEKWGGLSGIVVQHGISSKTENIGIRLATIITPEQVARKINAYQERINRKIDRLIDKKHRAMDVIERVQDGRLRTLLTLRYLRNCNWSSVADLMGYTQNWVEVTLKHEAIRAYEAAEKTM
jgi:hypothetical protein